MIFNRDDRGTEEIQPYSSQLGSHKFYHVREAVRLSLPQLTDIIGHDVYKELEAHYLSSDYGNTDTSFPADKLHRIRLFDEAVTFVQGALANLAYLRNIAKNSVLYDNSGINVVWSDKNRPATIEQLNELRKALLEDAYSYIGLLITHFNTDKKVFPRWENGKSEKLHGLLVRSLKAYEMYVSLDGSEAKFYKLLPRLRTVQESEVANVFGGQGGTGYGELLEFAAFRKEIGQYVTTASTDGFPANPAEGDTVLTFDTQLYYRYRSGSWQKLCRDMGSSYGHCVKGLIYHVCALEYRAQVNGLTGANDSKLSALRANADYYENLAKTELAKAVKAYEKQQEDIRLATTAVLADEETECEWYWGSENSFMM